MTTVPPPERLRHAGDRPGGRAREISDEVADFLRRQRAGEVFSLDQLAQAVNRDREHLSVCLTRLIRCYAAAVRVAPGLYRFLTLEHYDGGQILAPWYDPDRVAFNRASAPRRPEVRCCPTCALLPFECECGEGS